MLSRKSHSSVPQKKSDIYFTKGSYSFIWMLPPSFNSDKWLLLQHTQCWTYIFIKLSLKNGNGVVKCITSGKRLGEPSNIARSWLHTENTEFKRIDKTEMDVGTKGGSPARCSYQALSGRGCHSWPHQHDQAKAREGNTRSHHITARISIL